MIRRSSSRIEADKWAATDLYHTLKNRVDEINSLPYYLGTEKAAMRDLLAALKPKLDKVKGGAKI